jgi:hypothetical protein
MDAEIHDKVLTQGFDEVTELRAKEQANLADSIAAAKKQVASGRTASPLIRPASGQGQPEVQGWSQLGRKVVAPTPTTAPTGEPIAEPAPGQTPSPSKPAPSVNPTARPR